MLCESEDSDVACAGAGWLCALSVYKRDEEMISFLFSHTFTEKQKGSIVGQAAYCFTKESERVLSKKIILHFATGSEAFDRAVVRLIENKQISVTEDGDLLSCILIETRNQHGTELALNYLGDSACDLCEYLPALQAIAGRIDCSQNHFIAERIVTPLTRCVTRIFEESDQPEIKSACLNIWDTLYRNRVGRSLLAELMDRSE